ncbi:MAG: CapA family protein [Treponema sp.]|jgi:poly-gamma-glutamate synthesis protein (capsule biosynthesis protein)|nr:CapA family protein [Treponema sp.]
MNKKLFLLALTIFVLISFSCKYSKPITPDVTVDDIVFIEPEEVPVRYSLTLLAAGDNLFHETIIKSSVQDETYDFAPVYAEIKSLITKADLAFINQETVMAGEGYGYSGYPAFNTPQSLAKNLADVGFDIINHANNHALDMGAAGLLATLDMWDTIEGVTVIGARRSGEKHRIITKNNITLGFLSYTYGLNGNALPAANPDLVSLINRKTMADEIDVLRPLCDFLIVSIHWGEEYAMKPGSFQTGLAAFIAEHNVDVIIGHHPHVLQRFESLPRPDGKDMLCFYSLGNFVSNQRERERILGALMFVVFTKEDEELSVSDSGLIPVVCHIDLNYTSTKVFPLYSYSEEMLKKHHLRASDKNLTLDSFNAILNELGTKVIMDDPFKPPY